ncbi:MAG: 50S ribosomal protein L1 [Xanthomonadaceae bacterium]|nr:50S ribosomal protein L1 [Xanthomonadaceae bacterium]
MARISKRFRAMQGVVEPGKSYPVDAALQILKDHAKTKFVESVDVAIRLGIDAKKSDQGVRGSTVLPHGTGKTVRVAVFCPAGEKAEAAKAAGADVVGMDDLAQQMQDGDINFGVVIATPDAMRVVGKLGQLLGPRGLMPNPKVGTVTPDVVGAVRNAKAGQVRYRNDKAGIVHCSIGKVNFEIDALRDNLNALVADLMKVKPSTAKGQYLQKVSVSSTMGLGVAVDPSTLAATAAK